MISITGDVFVDKFTAGQTVKHLGDGTTMTVLRRDTSKPLQSYICEWRCEKNIRHANVFHVDLLSADVLGTTCSFEVGDVVMLNSGGQRMTVSSTYNIPNGCDEMTVSVECVWITDAGDSMSDTFNYRMLQYADNGNGL